MAIQRLAFIVFLIAAIAGSTSPGVSGERVAVPRAETLEKSLDLIRRLFKTEYENAQTDEQRTALAKKLIEHAIDSKDDVSGKYALLRVAKDVAIVASDVRTTLTAVDMMAEKYEIDALHVKSAALAGIVRKAIPRDSSREVISSLRDLTRQAVVADRYDLVIGLSDLSIKQARKVRDGKLVAQINTENEIFVKFAEQYKQVQAAGQKLETDPTDPAANLIVGSYRCLVKGDWSNGVSLLALGGDSQLKTLAVSELKESRTLAEDIALADGWWDVAESVDEFSATHIRRHAAERYQAIIGQVSGLTKAKVINRLESLADKSDVSTDPKVSTRPSRPQKQEDDFTWLPLTGNGDLTHCLKLGPYPRSAVNDQYILAYLSKGKYDKPMFGAKPIPDKATNANKSEGQSGGVFKGPAKEQKDHVMYFMFLVKSEKNQVVNLAASTFTRWEHSKVTVALNYRPVRSAGNVPLAKGRHIIIVKQHHMKSDRANRSWISLSIRGEGIQQAALTMNQP